MSQLKRDMDYAVAACNSETVDPEYARKTDLIAE